MTFPKASTIKANHRTVLPDRFVFLDTEAHREPTERGERQYFRLAVLRFDRKAWRTGNPLNPRYEVVREVRDVWRRIASATRSHGRLVVVCHNAGYDLQTSRALEGLSELGFELTHASFDTNRAWATWKRDTATIVVCDLSSWVARSLGAIGPWVGIEKPPLPAWDDTDAAWETRCRADVDILAAAWWRLMRWLDDNDCGMWRPTGAGQSWSAYRHKFHRKGVVHHGRDDLYELERVAVWCGRAEAWRHGKLTGGPFTEWDMTLAYANIGRECRVPIAPIGEPQTMTVPSFLSLRHRHGVLATVRVTVDEPCVPTRVDGYVVWPRGTFTTTLWDPELSLLIDAGAKVEFERTVLYKRAPILREWGDWITALLDEETGETDPVVRAMLKSWARTVPGRFGLSYAKWEEGPTPPEYAFSAGKLFEWGQPGFRRLMVLGDKTLVEGERTEAPDSVPSVMGWIMAECRRRLWREMTAIGLEHVVYVDTDGVIVDPEGSKRLRRRKRRGWREKGAWLDLEVIGPRQLVFGDEVKASGIPFRARVTEGHRWSAEVVQSPMAALEQGRLGAVEIRHVAGRLEGQDRRRDHRPDGRTETLRLVS